MTSQTCSQEEQRSGDPCSQSFSFFLTSQWHIIQKERGRERQRHEEREEERLNIWPKPECDFVFTQSVLLIDVFAFVAIV